MFSFVDEQIITLCIATSYDPAKPQPDDKIPRGYVTNDDEFRLYDKLREFLPVEEGRVLFRTMVTERWGGFRELAYDLPLTCISLHREQG